MSRSDSDSSSDCMQEQLHISSDDEPVDRGVNKTDSPCFGNGPADRGDLLWDDLVRIFKGLNYGKGVCIEERETFLIYLGRYVIDHHEDKAAFSSLFQSHQPYGLAKASQKGWHIVRDNMLNDLSRRGLAANKPGSERLVLQSLGDMMSIKMRGVKKLQPRMAAFLLLYMKVIYDLLPNEGSRPEFYEMFDESLLARETVEEVRNRPDEVSWLMPNLIHPGTVFLPTILQKDLPKAKDMGPLSTIFDIEKDIADAGKIANIAAGDVLDEFGIKVMENGLLSQKRQKETLLRYGAKLQKLYNGLSATMNEVDKDIRGKESQLRELHISASVSKWLLHLRAVYMKSKSTYEFMTEFVTSAVVEKLNESGARVKLDDDYQNWIKASLVGGSSFHGTETEGSEQLSIGLDQIQAACRAEPRAEAPAQVPSKKRSRAKAKLGEPSPRVKSSRLVPPVITPASGSHNSPATSHTVHRDEMRGNSEGFSIFDLDETLLE